MANPMLDLTILNFLTPIFTFLLVFALTYALTTKTDILGKNKIVALVVALSLASMATFAGRLSSIFELAIPWIILILVVGVIIFSLYGFFGVDNQRTWGFIGKPLLIVLIVTIFAISLAMVYEDVLSPYSQTKETTLENGTIITEVIAVQQDPSGEAVKALVHPRVFGAVFILAIAAVTAKLLTDKLRDD